jgi:predicted ferric reductase
MVNRKKEQSQAKKTKKNLKKKLAIFFYRFWHGTIESKKTVVYEGEVIKLVPLEEEKTTSHPLPGIKYSYRSGFLWLFMYTLLSLIPLTIAKSGSLPEYRTFWIEFGTALGFIGLAMFGLQFVFCGRFKQIAPTFGTDNVLQYHRQTGIIASLFILAHPIILLTADADFLTYLDPRVNALRSKALSFVILAVIFIVATSLWRKKFRLNYEKWRLIHGLLALVIVSMGTGHAILVSYYLSDFWKQALIASLMGSCMYLAVHIQVVRPWMNRKKPYRIIEVKKERGRCWTLVFEPIGHVGMDFACGQFIWVTIGSTPFSFQRHPFTITSSIKDKTISITTKAMGDFTSTLKDIRPGTKAFLDGPYGSFTPHPNYNLFFVVGGIGITPAISMLRTMRDVKDTRKAILIYGNAQWENIAFREELDEISKEIDLKIIHILAEPPDDWKGETGYIDQDFLARYLPEEPDKYMYFICGPNIMMDIAEDSLRNLDIDWRHIYTERFEIV